jgi:3D (Asp-Asp-Asp) domain-containing protein
VRKEFSISKWRIAFLAFFAITPIVLAFLALATLFFIPGGSFQEVFAHREYRTPIGPEAVIVLNATAYNSLESQTDSTPFITATGETTRPGLVALSRDLLEFIPYGSVVEILDIRPHEGNPNGCGATMQTVRRLETLPGLRSGQFQVEDTMHSRKENQIDVWLEHLEDAKNWGVCEVVIRAYEQEPLLLANGK